jgi:hypothetical protein
LLRRRWADGESHRPNILRKCLYGPGGTPVSATAIVNWGIKDHLSAHNEQIRDGQAMGLAGIHRALTISPLFACRENWIKSRQLHDCAGTAE